MRPGGTLVERDSELGQIDDAIAAALTGDGGVLVVEGPAGIGKTSLLDEAARRASASGMTVVSAQGAALERDFGFGAVRQLFEPVLRNADAATREGVLAGAAGLARPVVSPEADPAPTDQSAVMHGLYWLTANLATLAALFIVVDDVQWCDVATIQFLIYLARRLEGMAVTVLVAVRTGDPQADTSLLEELLATPAAEVVRPSPLSVDGVRELITERLGPPEPRFVEACHQATGGIPFLVGELLRVLSADGAKPTDAAAATIAATGPSTVAHATMLRLSRLPGSAASVARAVAVLGRQARLDRVAALAAVDLNDARGAVDALAGMEVFAAIQPPQFSHPLVRQAVYDDMSPVVRAEAHYRAADLLGTEDAPVEEVAGHLLLSDPAGRLEVVEALRAAATQALASGAATSAVAYLRRALAEGAMHGQEGAALVHELGGAEAFARDPRAVDDLAEARMLTDDPLVRARIGWELGQAQILSGAWATAQALFNDVLAELDGRDPDMSARIEAGRLGSDVFKEGRSPAMEVRLARLRGLAEGDGPGTRMLAFVLGAMGIFRGQDLAGARALIDRSLDGERLLREEGSESLALVQAVAGLAGLEDLDAVDRATVGVFDDAQRRGSVIGYIMGCHYRTVVHAFGGQLQVAESYLRSAIERSLEYGVTFAIPSLVWAGTNVLLERSGIADIADLVDTTELEPALLASMAGGWLLIARGRLRVQRGKREEGVADLRAGGAILEGAGMDNPVACHWRSPLALALPAEDSEEATELVAYELDRSRAMGLPRSEGVALRAAGMLEGGSDGIDLLRQSLAVVEKADAPLEQARTLVELGAVLRRSNQRASAREPLTAGLDLAHACGAERLAARALEELQASGARPRRPRTFGPDSLTSAEARVARMAADGMTNREIAQALFVTAKTVENQLGAVYRKLGVGSRDQLSSALSSELSS